MKKGELSESLLRGFWLGQFEVSRDTCSELGWTALRDCFGRQSHFVSMQKSCSKFNSLAKYHGYWNLNLCQCKVLSNTVPISDRWRNRLGTQEGKYCGLTIYRVSFKYCQGVYYSSVSTSLTSFPLANIDTDIELKKTTTITNNKQQWTPTLAFYLHPMPFHRIVDVVV